MQITFHAPPFGVARGDDAGPGSADLFELRLDLSLEAFVLEREPRSGPRRVHEVSLFQQRPIMDQNSQRSALCLDLRHRSRPGRVGQLDVTPGLVGGGGHQALLCFGARPAGGPIPRHPHGEAVPPSGGGSARTAGADGKTSSHLR